MRPGDLDTGERLIDSVEAAEMAGVTPRTLHAYVARRRAPQPDGQLGRTPVWRESTIAEWVAQRKAPPPPGANDRLDLRDAADYVGITYRDLLLKLETGELEPAMKDGAVTVRRGDLDAIRT